jgi:hypothetical protein
MTEPVTDKVALADEVKRRLRLERILRVGVTIGPHPGENFDVVVYVAPPNLTRAARIEELCQDIRVEVLQGHWERS